MRAVDVGFVAEGDYCEEVEEGVLVSGLAVIPSGIDEPDAECPG
jgi:hypothetical protein